MDDLKRIEFLKELKARKLMREAVRKAIHTVLEKRNEEDFERLQIEQEETALRSYIRSYLSETSTQDTDPAPHRSTGINVLSDLLKKIIPVLEDDYKILTTDADQRASFRAHVIHGVQNSLAPLQSIDDVGPDAGAETLQEIDVQVGGADEDAFIDIEDTGGEDEEISPEEEFGTGLDGQDLTGRNMAYSSFKKIERNILDSYELLSNNEDRELFYDYLITNLKLYFVKFEDELAGNLDEPTTPEYEDAADEMAADEAGEDFAPAGEEPMAGEDDEELVEWPFSITNGWGQKQKGKGKGRKG